MVKSNTPDCKKMLLFQNFECKDTKRHEKTRLDAHKSGTESEFPAVDCSYLYFFLLPP
jgi:hypothetical protein